MGQAFEGYFSFISTYHIFKNKLISLRDYYKWNRFFIGALIILPFVIKDLRIAKEDYKNIILLSIFTVSLQIPLLFFGLKLTPSINAPIIISLAPIILIFASVILIDSIDNNKDA